MKPCFVIAEIGVNHNCDIEIAKKLINAACECGADAVKFQSAIPELVVTVDAPMVAAMDGCYTTVATMAGATIKSGALRGARHARSVQAGRLKAPAARRSRRARTSWWRLHQ